MKRIVLILFSLVVTVLSSCDNTEGESLENLNSSVTKSQIGPWWYHFSCLPADPSDGYPCGPGSGCYSPGYSCILSTADLTFKNSEAVEKLIAYMEAGRQQVYFSQEGLYSELFPDLSLMQKSSIDSLANGLLTLRVFESPEGLMFVTGERGE